MVWQKPKNKFHLSLLFQGSNCIKLWGSGILVVFVLSQIHSWTSVAVNELKQLKKVFRIMKQKKSKQIIQHESSKTDK